MKIQKRKIAFIFYQNTSNRHRFQYPAHGEAASAGQHHQLSPGPTGLLPPSAQVCGSGPACRATMQSGRPGPQAAGHERNRNPGKAITVERQPGTAAHSPARMTMLETTLKSAKTSLCASWTSAFFFS